MQSKMQRGSAHCKAKVRVRKKAHVTFAIHRAASCSGQQRARPARLLPVWCTHLLSQADNQVLERAAVVVDAVSACNTGLRVVRARRADKKTARPNAVVLCSTAHTHDGDGRAACDGTPLRCATLRVRTIISYCEASSCRQDDATHAATALPAATTFFCAAWRSVCDVARHQRAEHAAAGPGRRVQKTK